MASMPAPGSVDPGMANGTWHEACLQAGGASHAPHTHHDEDVGPSIAACGKRPCLQPARTYVIANESREALKTAKA